MEKVNKEVIFSQSKLNTKTAKTMMNFIDLRNSTQVQAAPAIRNEQKKNVPEVTDNKQSKPSVAVNNVEKKAPVAQKEVVQNDLKELAKKEDILKNDL